MRISPIVLLFLLFPFFASSSTIRCSNAEYAGKKLDFFRLADPISGHKDLAFSLNFDQTGKCSATIETSKTIYTFCDFGIYRGMLLIEPNTTLQLKLPPFREKSFASQKNPYFTPAAFWFITESKDQVNDQVNGFEQQLNLQTDKHFNELFFQQSKVIYDSVLVLLNDAFPETTPKTFSLHKKLKIQHIKSDIFRLKPEAYSQLFNDIESEYWTHETFVALFEKTFDNQLSFSAKAIGGKKVSDAVGKKELTWLLNFVKGKYNVSGEMAELVLLKLLHDGFYSGYFSKDAIKEMVGANLFAQNTNSVIKVATKNIRHKFTFLEKGSLAPEICLNDLSGQEQCTNRNNEKFKYLVFADAETIVCQEHLKYLSRIHELFNKHLDIFVVLRNTDKKEIEKFFAANKIPVTTLIDKGNTYISEYKIRSFPLCFLLDEKHQVAFTSANAPLDGFEQQFGTYLRSELFMRQRNQAR